MKLYEVLAERCGMKTIKLYATKSMKGTWYLESDPLPEGFLEGVKEGQKIMVFKNYRKHNPEDPDMKIFLGRPRLEVDANADVAKALQEKEEREFQKYLDEDLREPYQELLGGLSKRKRG